ncbi:MAG: cell division protein [Magnetovibrio sp.]|nr:cell division protein [Magnetovibrio sp.]
MVFLLVMALAFIFVLNATASKWDRGVRGSLTVQIISTDDKVEDEKRLRNVLTLLATSPEVKRYEVMEDGRLIRLLEPWIGEGISNQELPLPNLVDVELKSSSDFNAQKLLKRLSLKDNGIAVDDHQVWLTHLVRLIETIEVVALLVLILILFATIGTIVFTTRTALAIHRDTIEVLHLIGAQDTYIARQFARRALGLGLSGGIIGISLAIPTLWMLWQLTHSLDEYLLPDISFGLFHWLLLAILPFGVSVISMLTAKITVMRALERTL